MDVCVLSNDFLSICMLHVSGGFDDQVFWLFYK